MTQRNIDVMDIIVSKMAEGATIADALKSVYHRRSVCIPCNESDFNISIMDLNLSNRTTNALLRGKINTLSEAINFCNGNKITDIATLGRLSGIELFETILNYCWNRMNDNEKIYFLIDTVKRNESYIKVEIEL